MTTEQEKIIDQFFNVSRYYKMEAHACLIGLGEMLSLTTREVVYIKIKGLPEMNVHQLTSHQLTTLTTWMNTKITFINNLRRHYFTDELKDLEAIKLEGCYRNVDIAVITFNNDFRTYEANQQNTILKNTLRSVGFGAGQRFGDIALIHYKPQYYTLNRWKRYWVDNEIKLSWDAHKPYKWAL